MAAGTRRAPPRGGDARARVGFRREDGFRCDEVRFVSAARARRGVQSVLGFSVPTGRGASAASRGLPSTAPNAQLSAFIVISIFVFPGTLTATGLKPKPQQFPGKVAFTSGLPVSASAIVNSGLVPSGRNFEYSSPSLP